MENLEQMLLEGTLQGAANKIARLQAENERLWKTLMLIYYFQPDVVETAAEQMRRFSKDALDKRLDAALAAGEG